MKANHNATRRAYKQRIVGLNISNSKNESKSQLPVIWYSCKSCWVKYQ
ncbi:hypothetical protein GO621_09440 [Mucilaginibacter sp. HMF7410]|uniref:Uncharacterized protein n=1 Tax=Mucilaginibacter arboris TaxID=2682090 RepID=A0A7K1SWP6_9SPHI|nr:hypothetical protein [Mucilaginibacter arboris]MVN21759.1 hypothetical protein [Mucilaginibacter arboris]